MVIAELLNYDTLILLVALVVFIVIGYKVLSVLKNAIIISFLAAVFPIFLNKFFGTALATSLNAELMYVLAGIGLYIIYEALVVGLRAGGILWSLLKLAANPFVWIGEAIKKLFGGREKKEEHEKQKENTE